ncbi:methylmalonyl-CoA mutase family protein [Zavarzinia sp.]|uniref:methylmalonyl-CoA mutase family protein n=1 Tax=Zavarzinia sp. TaxID=2027920 RepID=UPI0035636720
MAMTTQVAAEKSTRPPGPATYADWRSTVEQELKGVPIGKKLVTRTAEGIEVQPLYRREDAAALKLATGPGEPPYLRGTRPPAGRAWRWEAGRESADNDFSPLPALALALAQSKPGGRAAGTVTADPLGWLLDHGSLPMPLADCLNDLAEGLQTADKAGRSDRVVGIGAQRWHECGATAVQELAFALAAGAEYWRALLDRGLTSGQIAPRTQLGFAVGVDFFLEIAKLRAARVLWAGMTGAFGADAGARKAHLAVRTARWDKTLYDPHVNLLRVTTQALAAVVGGADAIDIRPFDEVTGAPTELGRRLSHNLHDILAEEFALENQIDPAGGSWYVEVLTGQLAQQAWALFQDIEKRGGMAAAILAGYPQQLAAGAAGDRQAQIDTRRRPILGTTVQPNLREEPKPAPATPVPAGAKRKSVPKPIKSFSALRAAAAKRTTLPTLRLAWTQKRAAGPTATALQPFRAAEGFEAVRRAGDDFLARTGRRARVFLARMGPPKQHKARADFSAGFFAAGGFEIEGKTSFATAAEAAAAAVASGAAVAVLCSTDETYPELAPAFARAVKAARPALAVVLAGHPGEREAEFRAAGFDEFIHLRANVRTTLARLQHLAGLLP